MSERLMIKSVNAVNDKLRTLPETPRYVIDLETDEIKVYDNGTFYTNNIDTYSRSLRLR